MIDSKLIAVSNNNLIVMMMLLLHLLLQHCLAAPCAGAFIATGEGGAGLGSGQAILTIVSWTHVGTVP